MRISLHETCAIFTQKKGVNFHLEGESKMVTV